jgi:hypothetical protein
MKVIGSEAGVDEMRVVGSAIEFVPIISEKKAAGAQGLTANVVIRMSKDVERACECDEDQ